MSRNKAHEYTAEEEGEEGEEEEKEEEEESRRCCSLRPDFIFINAILFIVLLQVLCVLLQVLRVLLQVLGPPAAPTHGLTNRSRWTSAVKCTVFSGHPHRK
ncbi:hypothetical protein EYF80_032327 [Liparis tanakae]|uniref:Uncharacterized protein n=1 Tax=Liparis tanakae TaxID=230148 RepID=A0A4Z2GXK4_9TELE|nr:hypothetical protein EYF80_032327 [Liparis tanakae]